MMNRTIRNVSGTTLNSTACVRILTSLASRLPFPSLCREYAVPSAGTFAGRAESGSATASQPEPGDVSSSACRSPLLDPDVVEREVFPPLVGRRIAADDHPADESRLARRAAQRHARLGRRAVALARVARGAARDEVLPRRAAAAAARHDVVHRH